MIENFNLNKDLFYFLNSFAKKNDFLDFLFIFLGEYLIFFIILFFIIFFWFKIWEDRKIKINEIIFYFFGAVFAWFLTKIIKFIFPIERPFSFLENVNQLSVESSLSSFPSGHSTLAFSLAFSIFLYNKKIGFYFLLLAFLVSLGRVFIGVHFPLDILIGAVLGISISFLFFYIFKILQNKEKTKF